MLVAWPTWFIVYVLSPCRYVGTQFIAWHTWYIVLSPWFVSMHVCRYPVSLWHGTHGSLSYVSMQVSCQLTAWHTWFIVLCLHVGMQVSCRLMAWHWLMWFMRPRNLALSSTGLVGILHCNTSPVFYKIPMRCACLG